MADELKKDKYGDEYRVVEGKTMVALWVPISLAEKEKLMAKAAAGGIRVQDSVAAYLRESLVEKESKEFDLADLEKVVGGVMAFPTPTTPTLKPPTVNPQPTITPSMIVDKYRVGYSTVMCPW